MFIKGLILINLKYRYKAERITSTKVTGVIII